MNHDVFEVEDRVELVSSSFEDSGLFSGDTGVVINQETTVLRGGHVQQDIRVRWDNGHEDCWIAAEEFVQC